MWPVEMSMLEATGSSVQDEVDERDEWGLPVTPWLLCEPLSSPLMHPVMILCSGSAFSCAFVAIRALHRSC